MALRFILPNARGWSPPFGLVDASRHIAEQRLCEIPPMYYRTGRYFASAARVGRNSEKHFYSF
ncbi:hypothetical protein A3C17_01135 [Candidatus Uhrbacteria bacterium RIFCSPHIGHO2_02_FULL_53_13]|uniref:Uncharacterized protein n=1 Tax=Candidatus Uhrbacteria bacterium RIFCSPHIGHO2_02_FULL_53_13 TaxID=1802389 RepID=A0A1F7TYL0_9BACT|nr:MAG: hypothetical protein A3C17_01135 [Candidatus Uhrbacteria bacterium RIFCSPHIGHO2_02_FULL_53_13]